MSKLRDFAKTFAELGHRRVRKNPRIHPRAKSKRMNIKETDHIDPVEDELLTKWWTDYRLQYNAVKKLFQFELERQNMNELACSKTDDASDRLKRKELSEIWNKETHIRGREKLETILKTLVDEENQRITQFDTVETAKIAELNEKISSLVLSADQMITKANIDEKIDEIMNSNIIDYNFLVDNKGRMIKGSESMKIAQIKSTDDTTPSPLTATV